MSGSPKNKVGAPLGLVEPGWSVEKIKLMGADAVKLLAQFEPTEPLSAEHQFQLIDHIYAECKKYDILFLLETVAFPFGGEKKTDVSFLNRKATTVIESARQLSRFCDIYKAEFPGIMGRETDNQLRDNLQALNAASERPWVLLSAGVDYPDYFKQVQMAMGAGASGVLGGRAFWKEYFLQDSSDARSQFAATTAFKRVADVNTVVREHGTPWYARYGFSKEDMASIRASEGWHARYGSPLSNTQGSASAKGGAGRSLLIAWCRWHHVGQTPLGKDPYSQGVAKPALASKGRRGGIPQGGLIVKKNDGTKARPESLAKRWRIDKHGTVDDELAGPPQHKRRGRTPCCCNVLGEWQKPSNPPPPQGTRPRNQAAGRTSETSERSQRDLSRTNQPARRLVGRPRDAEGLP